MSTPEKTINRWKYRMPELREMLKERGLPVSGPKRDLVNRFEQDNKRAARITGLSRCWFCGSREPDRLGRDCPGRTPILPRVITSTGLGEYIEAPSLAKVPPPT